MVMLEVELGDGGGLVGVEVKTAAAAMRTMAPTVITRKVMATWRGVGKTNSMLREDSAHLY